MSVVFDSSALLALTFGEEGAEVVARALSEGILSAVNASELIARYVEQGANEEEAREWFRGFDLEIRTFDEALAVAAGLMRKAMRERGLSLGDRACMALAIREGARVLTADQAWAGLDLDVEVELIC